MSRVQCNVYGILLIYCCCLQVKKEYKTLHNKYAPLWQKEEEERCHRWNQFLSSFHGGSGSESRQILSSSALVKVCTICSGKVVLVCNQQIKQKSQII